jgi:EAL domain-containing protein (putative c-di-GMP-specific phosphodiesterase class I)
MDHADAALYKAKDSGRHCFAYFSEALTIAARQRIELEARLRLVIEREELRVHYQAQVDIATGNIIGAEALIRWQQPIDGFTSPAQFIHFAEQTGFITTIGAWILRETCRQGKQWLDAGLPPLVLAVNVSPHQFQHVDMIALVVEILKDTEFPAHYLELELTESGLMDNQDHARFVLENLRQLGIQLAIDDFGTGYSSLAYLKNFPISTLKIDKGFIDDIPHKPDDMAIAATIIAMGHILGFKVLAEGVETAEQLAFLQEKGCDRYQGYIKSRPLPAQEFEQLLRNQQDIM